jgi:hypothetical protein
MGTYADGYNSEAAGAWVAGALRLEAARCHFHPPDTRATQGPGLGLDYHSARLQAVALRA